MTSRGPPKTKVQVETSLENPDYDAIILVASPEQKLQSGKLQTVVSGALNLDPSLKTELAILPVDLPAGRVVYSPTGPIDDDYGDVRSFKDSAKAAVKRALKAGIRRPLLVLEGHPRFEQAELVTLLGVLEALYTPIQIREHDPSKTHKVDVLGVFTHNPDKTEKLVNIAQILEEGRRVACDIGDCDPERMAPPRIEEYLKDLFAGTGVNMEVVSDVGIFKKDYPLFEAVNRAASCQERHKGRIVYLEYNPPETVEKTLYLVGKGVTYDTGGADVKISGNMVGMSRDKCGAAAAAGFMHIVRLLQPKNIKVVVGLSLVRNSIGSNSYVADEVITARSGARVRVVNTDAEGRMVMADVLCKFKEAALRAVNPHIFTIATLTGHACRTVGLGYTIIMDNGPARNVNTNRILQEASEKIADPFEISTIRREDFANHKGIMEGDDVIQSQAKPSIQVSRGHQGPAAFLIMASGLEKHGSGSSQPLKYSHLDIAASSGDLPNPATGSPILALAQAYLL
ncbi:unnamed protein product [Phaedon cochleariae]|uniref:Cytosol aminopeptidase domain-containing protein n=1 Tax=Phaedon cochleariae TaxID=80249 RepID=A0A9P0DLI4_PHACE|nr:unnamed protein product [Phaedon cochleariae]